MRCGGTLCVGPESKFPTWNTLTRLARSHPHWRAAAVVVAFHPLSTKSLSQKAVTEAMACRPQPAAFPFAVAAACHPLSAKSPSQKAVTEAMAYHLPSASVSCHLL